ncbi:GlxA family transcriptional regulator [Maribacter sp. X9]|uniref:GlxA family transcriptional regulator n=1 Tax=Maribacter sp. X9 TaxID=3402159 RepID=UPI003AF343F0
MNVSILVLENSVIQAIADPQYLLSAVNQFMSGAGKKSLFNVQLVGWRKQMRINNGSFAINTTHLLKDVKQTDLIIIPALFGDMKTAIAANKKVLPWIKEQYKNGAEIASLCVGSFLLASTGLLDGKKCSTHWGFQNEFRELFPEVEVVEGNIITEEHRIYSSGGAHSYWNLLLHLVEKYTDRETAILASKYFAIDIDRESQTTFAIFKGQKTHTDEAVKKAQDYIEKNYQDKITIEDLTEFVSVGRRSFERRFKLATANTVLEYIQRIKVEAAKRSFENSRKNMNEVMFDVGYTDTKSFRRVFKKITGLTPIEYRNKYNKMVV